MDFDFGVPHILSPKGNTLYCKSYYLLTYKTKNEKKQIIFLLHLRYLNTIAIVNVEQYNSFIGTIRRRLKPNEILLIS